jgi:hypothetical protein
VEPQPDGFCARARNEMLNAVRGTTISMRADMKRPGGLADKMTIIAPEMGMLKARGSEGILYYRNKRSFRFQAQVARAGAK